MERNTWWLGVWMRGLRRTGWTNVKPACWWFTEGDLASDDPAQRQRTINLRNALAPVALFDVGYDDLGISPFVTGTTPGGTLPALAAGSIAERELILYNDEFRGTDVDVSVRVIADGKVRAEGTARMSVGLGEHRALACRFVIPDDAQELVLELRTAKGGEDRFMEQRRFRVGAALPHGPKHELPLGRVEIE